VKKLDKADAVVAVVSKSAVESSWMMTELGIAWGANKKIIGVLAPDEPPDELGISPLKDVKLLRVAKTDVAQLPVEILKATSDARTVFGRIRRTACGGASGGVRSTPLRK
jgi:hypothetical protein